MRKVLLTEVIGALKLLLLSSLSFSQNVVTVTDCNLNGWLKQPIGNSKLGFVTGPSTPPLGKGSLKFYVPPGTNPDWPGDFVRFRNGQYSGTPLSALTELSYATYIEARDTIVDIPFIVILIDINNDGTAEHNLVFDPRYQNPKFIKGTMPDQGITKEHEWQKWDCLHAGWFFGGTADTDPDHNGPFFTLTEYMKLYPNATIRNDAAKGGPAIRLTAGGVVFKANFYGEIDAFKIGINGVTTTYDFEASIADAGPDKNVIYGYGSNCTILNGAASGGIAPYTYSWSDGSTPGNINTTVCPTTTTKYTLTVTDKNGCVGTDDMIVNVKDVRCGDKLDKVWLCHNGKEICVAKEAVPAHLNHGDVLGSCKQISGAIAGKSSIHNELPEQNQLKLSGYPNPFVNSTSIEYALPANGKVTIKLYDISGKEIKTLVDADKKAGRYKLDFTRGNLSAGMYFARAVLSTPDSFFSQIVRLIIFSK